MAADRRAVYGALVFIGLLIMCLGVSFVLLRGPVRPHLEGPRVGVVEINGPILRSRVVLEQLRALREDPEIHAIVIRLNTPGGAVGPSQEIYREIEKTRDQKPVVASMESVAASGGYYIAAACAKIVANPGTLTGSIGVITQTAEVNQLLDMLKLRVNVLKSGPLKDSGSPLRTMSDADRALFQTMIDQIFEQFLSDVARGRRLDKEAVRPFADGRVLTGEQAKKANLVDRLGNFTDAMELAVQMAKGPKEEGDPVPIYPPGGDKSLLRRLLSMSLHALAEAFETTARGTRVPEVRAPGLNAP